MSFKEFAAKEAASTQGAGKAKPEVDGATKDTSGLPSEKKPTETEPKS